MGGASGTVSYGGSLPASWDTEKACSLEVSSGRRRWGPGQPGGQCVREYRVGSLAGATLDLQTRGRGSQEELVLRMRINKTYLVLRLTRARRISISRVYARVYFIPFRTRTR